MSNLNEVYRRNRELAEKIDTEARANPQSPYAGKFIAIIDGQVALVADDGDTLIRRLSELKPLSGPVFFLEVARDPNKPVYV